MDGQMQHDPGEGLVEAAKLYIEAHSREKFSLKRLSEALYVNGCYLLRLFKARTGQTLLEYHNAVRCENAKTLLCESEMSISEVGESTGFVSSSHFSHVFKKMTGFTPSEYRSKHTGTVLLCSTIRPFSDDSDTQS